MNPLLALLNPWVLIGAFLAIATSFVAGDRHGRNAVLTEAKAEQADAVVENIKESNALAGKDQERAVVAETKRVEVRAAAVSRAVQIEERIRTEIVYRDRECRADDATVRLLNDAIAGASQASAPAASSGDRPVSAPGPP